MVRRRRADGGRDRPKLRLVGEPELLSEGEFDDLMRAHFDDIWRYALRRTATPDDADDVAAEVFAVLWRRRADLPARGEVRLWLYGVARNVLANQHRADRRRDRLEAKVSSQPVRVVAPVDCRDDTLQRAMATLSDADRDLLLMRAQDELPVADIARLLGCTRTAASLRLRRARQRLQQALDAVELPENSKNSLESAKHRNTAGHVRSESSKDGKP